MSDLSKLVTLYRLSNLPSCDGREFSAVIPYTTEVRDLLVQISATSKHGSFELIEIDQEIYDIGETLPLSGKEVYFIVTLSRGDAVRFYLNKEDLLKINSLKKGVLPQDFYIIDIDYYYSEKIKNEEIEKLIEICSLIQSISKLAHYHDTKTDSQNYRLVFIKNADGNSTSIVIEPAISLDMLKPPSIGHDFLKNLCNDESLFDPHHNEKIGVFRNTIVEFSEENNLSFPELVKNWDKFNSLYQNNLAVYLSGFSFHKTRKEVAKAESELAEKLSKITGDITLKILSIPVSFLAAIGMLKLSNINELLISLFGLAITSVLIFLMIYNQEKQFQRICHAKDLLFTPFISKLHTYPEELADEVRTAIDAFDQNQDLTKKTIIFFKVTSWSPTFLAGLIFIVKVTNIFYK
ncbi:hypothetical protein L581_3158 [Serratia fonticola AU-AP2C]|nr:hypothetical protein L581_3158 [Serratia fonticola AU-AP2C]